MVGKHEEDKAVSDDMPPIGTRRRADQAAGWDRTDSDLRELTGAEIVELCMVGTADFPNLARSDVEPFWHIYRQKGAAGLPPLWAWEGGRFPLLITGSHRSTAAHRAGLMDLPAWVVVDESDDEM